MKTFKFVGSKNSGANKWFMQRVSGIALVIFLIGHYFLMHYTPSSGHTYEAVIQRLSSPLWKLIDLSFITFGLWHGLNGTWSVFRDYKMTPFWSITFQTLIIVSGLAFWFLGINTVLSFK